MKKYLKSMIMLVLVLLTVTAMVACSTPTPTPVPTPKPSPSVTPPPVSTPAPSPTPKPSPSPTTSVPPSPTPSPTAAVPTLTITSPGNNIFGIGKATVTVQVTNFNIVNALGQPAVAGQGHLHYYMDVDAPTAQGKPAVTAPGTYAATANTTYVWSNVPGGPHKFSVELANNDHTPLNPPVIATVNTLVIPEIGPPQLVIASPRDGAVVTGNSVTITAQAANFNIVDKLGGVNAQREGHFHYFMDVEAPTVAGKPAVTAPGTYAATANTTYTWTNVTPGLHTFSAELINNDHTPLDPPVVTKISVNVAAPAPSPSPTAAPTAVINLSASSFAFNMSTISVPAGAAVTVNFNNMDSGIPHNFSVYQKLAGGQTNPIFVGKVISGPDKIVYTFTAPKDMTGSYFFMCDIHPTQMTGTFTITAP